MAGAAGLEPATVGVGERGSYIDAYQSFQK